MDTYFSLLCVSVQCPSMAQRSVSEAIRIARSRVNGDALGDPTGMGEVYKGTKREALMWGLLAVTIIGSVGIIGYLAQ